MEHDRDSDYNCSWCAWNGIKRLGKGTKWNTMRYYDSKSVYLGVIAIRGYFTIPRAPGLEPHHQIYSSWGLVLLFPTYYAQIYSSQSSIIEYESNPICTLCKQKTESVDHLISGCPVLIQIKYEERHDEIRY